MIIESVCIAVRPANREELRRAFAAWKGPTEVEPGCKSCKIRQQSDDPDAFCYEARWNSEEDLLHHLRSDHYKRLLVLMDMGEEEPVIEFHTVLETVGLDLIQRVRNGS
jgi:quinol monooxygenase YgiN